MGVHAGNLFALSQEGESVTMRTWTMRDLPGLVENLDGIFYGLQLAVEEGSRKGVVAAVKAMEVALGVIGECVEGEKRGRKDER